MHYKFFRYSISSKRGDIIAPDRHYDGFVKSIGPDMANEFAKYRNQKNAVLMYLRKFGSDFSGLVGKHSTEREVTNYDRVEDETSTKVVADDDYPHAPFVCMPRLGIIACVDGAILGADSAMARLHAILAHRTNQFFVIEAIRESQDLRKAVALFNLTEVSFEVNPVNPHTGPLGMELDEDRAKDHIRKIKGKVEAVESKPLVLEGGFLTQVQQLQKSGHAKVGYKGVMDNGVRISVSKPQNTRELGDEIKDVVHGEELDVKVEFPGFRMRYPFDQKHVTDVRTVARRLTDDEKE
jgi:hypothetical protein